MGRRPDWDAAIIGGGFFGCCLALFLRSAGERVVVLEREPDLMRRASRVNQARVHSGFHYPRSMVTAKRSRALQQRFVRGFPDAVVDDFQMLYALAARRSKVSPSRFAGMFAALEAPFSRASRSATALFDPDEVAAVFACQEFAFDHDVLRASLRQRLISSGVALRMGVEAQKVSSRADMAVVETSTGAVTANRVFNVAYAGLNALAAESGLQPLPLKHEFCEVALVRPPPELEGLAVTVMDGPFFSTMPFPAEGLNSLTHVRYTPHYSWTDAGPTPGLSPADGLPRESRGRQMIADAARFLPCMADARRETSLWDIKTVLLRNERDDGRPILLHRHPESPRLTSILGAKMDHVFDLFDALVDANPHWRNVGLAAMA